MRNKKILIALLLVFLSGVIIGGFIGYYSGKRRYPRRSIKQHMIEKLAKKLDLNAEQMKAVEHKVDENIRQFQQLRDKHLPELVDEISRSYDNIKPLLTPEQQQKLEALKVEMMNRLMRKMKADAAKQQENKLPQ